MRLIIPVLISLFCVLFVLCGCGSASSKGKSVVSENRMLSVSESDTNSDISDENSDSSGESDKYFVMRETIYTGGSDHKEIITEYVNPYECSETDSEEKKELYNTLLRNGVDLAVKVCKELRMAHWENIVLYNGFPSYYPEHYLAYITEEEANEFVFMIHADSNGGRNDAYVIISLSEDNPEGKVNYVGYNSTYGEWPCTDAGYPPNTIIDAYTVKLMEICYAY